MKILHLIPQLAGGGAERQLGCLAPEMAKLGHEVHIAFIKEGSGSISYPAVRIHSLAVLGNHDPVLFLKLLQLIRTIRPDIIQSWIVMMDILAGFLSLVTNTAWILREPTAEADYRNFNLKKAARAWLGHRASAIVANSQSGRSYWLRQGISESKLNIIPNAVPFDIINAVKPRQNRCDMQKILIFAGRIIPSKNIDILIQSMAMIRRHQNVLLLIAGDGPEKHNLMSLVEELELNDTVRFLGYLPPYDLWAYMKASDAFVSMSGYEGMPNIVTEAIACGIPVLLSDIPAHRAFLDDESAIFVPIQPIHEVVTGICHTLEHTLEAGQRAAKAFDAIRDKTPNVMASEYIRLYKKLIA